MCVCKRDVHALHWTAEQTSPAACREDNSRCFRRYQANCTSLHNELMSMAIPTALAPHNVRPALAAQSLPQQLLPLCIGDVVPSYFKRSRQKLHGLLESPVVPERRGGTHGLDKISVYECYANPANVCRR